MKHRSKQRVMAVGKAFRVIGWEGVRSTKEGGDHA